MYNDFFYFFKKFFSYTLHNIMCVCELFKCLSRTDIGELDEYNDLVNTLHGITCVCELFFFIIFLLFLNIFFLFSYTLHGIMCVCELFIQNRRWRT